MRKRIHKDKSKNNKKGESMKKKLFTITMGLIMVVSWNAKADDTIKVDGAWNLVDRICTDGQPTNDQIELGRDQMIVVFANDKVYTTVTINNHVFKGEGTFKYGNHLLISEGQDGKTTTSGYTMKNNNELIIINAGFKNGGTCNEGTAMLSIFERITIK
jgi:hypothetical protein